MQVGCRPLSCPRKQRNILTRREVIFLVEFASAGEGQKSILSGEYDLYLVSPQIRMLYKKIEKAGEKAGKPVVNIPPDAYVPTPAGIEKLERIILENLLK